MRLALEYSNQHIGLGSLRAERQSAVFGSAEGLKINDVGQSTTEYCNGCQLPWKFRVLSRKRVEYWKNVDKYEVFIAGTRVPDIEYLITAERKYVKAYGSIVRIPM